MSQLEDRSRSTVVVRAWWEVRHRTRWGLLVLLSTHQFLVGCMLVVDLWILNRPAGVAVPADDIWPIVFLLGSLGAFDIYARRYRSRTDLAHFLMQLAYGSRALGVLWGGIFDGWTVSTTIGLFSWPLLMVLTQWAWSEARGAL